MATDIKIDVMALGTEMGGGQLADAGDIRITFGREGAAQVVLPMKPQEAIEFGKELIRLGYVGRRTHKKEWNL